MNFIDAVSYINSFINFEKIPKYRYASSFKLERMEAILKEIGDPHKNLNIVHVAGSKGKGSTCAITAYILKEAGYKTGLYTSPHLVNFRERIRILDSSKQDSKEFEGMISGEDFSELIEEIMPAAEKFREHKKLGKASFFEILTACAFLYFKKTRVDIAVLETGLGGRLDATNVATPLVSGITSISLEHTDKLGGTLGKIAREKAGIIKDRGLVVSASQKKEAAAAIRKACREKNAKLLEIGKDIAYSVVDSGAERQVLDLRGPGYSYDNLKLGLIGTHQAENASISVGMLKLMDQDKFNIKESSVRNGLKKAIWPGRLQIARKGPYVILDGAQNSASALALTDSVKSLFNYKKLICVFGISSDKDIKGVSSILDKASDKIVLTRAKDNPRAENTSRLRRNFSDSRPGLEESDNINDAMRKALKMADEDDLILVTGSLFVVGDAIKYFKLRE